MNLLSGFPWESIDLQFKYNLKVWSYFGLSRGRAHSLSKGQPVLCFHCCCLTCLNLFLALHTGYLLPNLFPLHVYQEKTLYDIVFLTYKVHNLRYKLLFAYMSCWLCNLMGLSFDPNNSAFLLRHFLPCWIFFTYLLTLALICCNSLFLFKI